jgi:serine/threonine protein kinase
VCARTLDPADFGLARLFQSPLRKLSEDGEVVTIWYRAPELLLGSRHYTRAIDIYALGCIFFELLSCTPLFPGQEMSGTKIFQENQMKEIFRTMGKPTIEQWRGMQDCPHYPIIKAWNAKESVERRGERAEKCTHASAGPYARRPLLTPPYLPCLAGVLLL